MNDAHCPICEKHEGEAYDLLLANSDDLPEDALRCSNCFAPFLLWQDKLHVILREAATVTSPEEELFLTPVTAYLSAEDPTMKEEGVYNSSVFSYTSLMNKTTKTNSKPANPTSTPAQPRNPKPSPNQKEKDMPKAKTTAVNDTPVVREKLEGSLTPADLAAEFNLTPPRFRAVLRSMTNEGILPARAKRSRWLWHPDHDGDELEVIRNHMKAQNEKGYLKPAADAPAEKPAPKKAPAKKAPAKKPAKK